MHPRLFTLSMGLLMPAVRPLPARSGTAPVPIASTSTQTTSDATATSPARTSADFTVQQTTLEATPPAVDPGPPGDPFEGAALAQSCQSCHSLVPGGAHKYGPNLFGVWNRRQGDRADYRYGSYLKAQNAAGATWNEASLRAWLTDSKKVAKDADGRTKMAAQELTDAQLNDLLSYLQTLR